MTKPCTICAEYSSLRGKRIRAEIAKTTPQRDRAAQWHRFMEGVHERHIAQTRANVRALGRVVALLGAANDLEETR